MSFGEAHPCRVYFLDNLRTVMILLVVLCHAGWVYESSGLGAYFWIVHDPTTNDLCGLLNIVLDILVLPTLFFISGYLASASLEGKTGWAFLKARFARLMLPWIIAVLTLIPVYKVIFLFSRHRPQENWSTYFHFSNGILSQSWLWFLPVLFLFDILYLLLRKSRIRIPNLTVRTGVCGAVLIGFAYSVVLDTLGLQGWTKIGLLDFQNERLLIYFMAFLLGALCFRRNAFGEKPRRKKLYVMATLLAWIPVTVYVVFRLRSWFQPSHFVVSQISDRLILWFSYQLSLLCLVYVMIETFRRYQNRPGAFRNELNRNSFHVYIVHVIVMGGFALGLLHMAMPSALKYLILVVSTFVASNLAARAYRTVAGSFGWRCT